MGRFSETQIDWAPFTVCRDGEKAPYPRSLNTPEGLGDRLRFVAFAEKQASHAFTLAVDFFEDVSPGVHEIWQILAREESKHLQWLLWRMEELGVNSDERPQSLALWKSFDHCTTAYEFAVFMANAEERGRIAGEQFFETLMSVDPTSAKIFYQIALEEREHIRLAQTIIDQNFKVPTNFEVRLNTVALERFATIQTLDLNPNSFKEVTL